MKEHRPGDTITVDGNKLVLLTRWQDTPGAWWAIDANGKAHGVRCNDDGWEWYDV
jgi:hypothetical protein